MGRLDVVKFLGPDAAAPAAGAEVVAPAPDEPQVALADPLAGGGAVGTLIRVHDWSRTPLGPVATWPQSLRTAASICLGTSFPMMIAWGHELLMLYNDGYVPVLGDRKHPGSLGRPLLEVFAEIRDILAPLFRGVMATGEPFGATDMMFPLERSGYTEETYFVFSYSPIRDETGGVGGVLTTCTETTERVIGERRLRTLRALAERAAHATTPDEAMAGAAKTLDPADIPFAAFYLVDETAPRAWRVATSGLDEGNPACPAFIELVAGRDAPWPLASIRDTRAARWLTDLDAALGPLPGGPWPEPATQALVLPIDRPGGDRPCGFAVLGISPRRAFDDSYRAYLELVTEHVATSLANARAREEQRRRAESLAEIDRAKTAFFSNVSHEFRTPLTLILGPLRDLLAGTHGPLPEKVRGELEPAHRNALRLLKLVNTLLDFARIEAGRMEAVYEPVDLATTTHEIAGSFRSAIERAGLRFVVEAEPLPWPVYVDVEMWEKIVLNLLSNAFKFTFAGTIRLSLRERAGRVELEVADTGTGIPREEVPNLFRRFHRVQNARGRTQEGSGIGLALVQDLLRLHGGEIRCASELGLGTTFRVTMPRGKEHLPADRIGAPRTLASTAIHAPAFVEEAERWLFDDRETLGTSRPAVAAPAAVAPRERLLVADDNADMRAYLERILGEHWDVEAVPDGAAALEAARRRPPDLVLTDVMMPVLDGFGLIRELRGDERTRSLPIVVLSARAGDEARIEGIERGADDYLIKPFAARELITRVRAQIALARSRRAAEAFAAERERLLEAERRARREAELQREHLHSLFMQAPTPICILRGRDHVIELANRMCCEVWGRGADQVIGRPLLAALPELEGQPFRELLDGVLAAGEPYVGREIPADLVAGGVRRTRWFNFAYAPLRDAEDEVAGVLVIAFDVSDEIRARDELTRTIHHNELFAGMLGHDLRNPLAAIMTAAELILRRGGDGKVVAPATRIMASGERMSRMIDQLLDFTRIRTGGGLTLRAVPTDLAALAHHLVDEVARANGRTFAIEVRGDPAGLWDQDRLAQVISNLAGNAIHHGDRDGTPRLLIDGCEPDMVRLHCENAGTIPAGLLPVLFDPFQGGGTRARHSNGLGLGLYISREIVLAHRGDLTVDSREGRTRFTAALPRTANVAEDG